MHQNKFNNKQFEALLTSGPFKLLVWCEMWYVRC